MTDILCYTDSYLKEFEANITHTRANSLVLNRTAFYPGGGGQPPDTGILKIDGNDYQVNKVVRSDGQILHNLDRSMPSIPKVGAPIHGMIDWDRRYQLMRTHTALHILCGVIWRDYGVSVTGGDMKPLSARMDFEFESISANFSINIQTLINKEVQASRPVKIGQLPRKDALQNSDLIRTKINLLPKNIAEVRTVDIVGLDLQADGGTHVANTKEVGYIHVVGHESKGRANKRLRIKLDS